MIEESNGASQHTERRRSALFGRRGINNGRVRKHLLQRAQAAPLALVSKEFAFTISEIEKAFASHPEHAAIIARSKNMELDFSPDAAPQSVS